MNTLGAVLSLVGVGGPLALLVTAAWQAGRDD